MRLLTILIILFGTIILVCSATPKAMSAPSFGEAMPSLGGRFDCDPALLQPSKSIPTNVNSVRPADIKIIGALGDSITAGSRAKNAVEQPSEGTYYVGNSFAIGGDEILETHITMANIFRHLNPNLVGFSTGVGDSGRGFNVAISGKQSIDLPEQAERLVALMKHNPNVNIEEDWKFINIFIGTNDLAQYNGYPTWVGKDPIEPDVYKNSIEKAIGILKASLPRTIVNILGMYQPQFIVDAKSLIETGKRLDHDHPERMAAEEKYCANYRKAVYDIQDSKMFETDTFTVVVQGFLNEQNDAFRNSTGEYDASFYALDLFHFSKYGHAVAAKWLWNGLVEPVGQKSQKVPLGDNDSPLKPPAKECPFIRTIGNSF